MPTSVGPNTFGEENLVFGYDLGDTVNSYKGEPTTNLHPNPEDVSSWTGNLFNNWINSAVTSNASIAPNGTLTADRLGDGYGRFNTSVSITAGQTYTYTVYLKNISLTNNFDIVYAWGLNGSLVSYGTATNVSISQLSTSEWTRVTATLTAPASGVNQVQFGPCPFTGYGNPSGQTIDVWGGMIEQKSHATPYTTGTRSATQGLIDLTGNSTIDLTNVSFDSSAQMTFDGTNDKIQGISTVHSHLSSSAIEFVVTPTTTGKKMTVGGYRHNEGYSSPTIGMVYIDSDNKFYASVITAAEVYRFVVSTTTIQANKTYHVVFNKDTSAGIMQLYVNGVGEGAQTFNVATYAQWSSAGNYIGSDILDLGKSNNTNSGQGWSGDFLQGEIDLFKLYGRTLSASEIRSNYNAIKSRFSI